jgi:hypothetical protein
MPCTLTRRPANVRLGAVAPSARPDVLILRPDPGRRCDLSRNPKTFRHASVGDITVDCDSLADRDQHLVLYTAALGSRDADALALVGMMASPRGRTSGNVRG